MNKHFLTHPVYDELQYLNEVDDRREIICFNHNFSTRKKQEKNHRHTLVKPIQYYMWYDFRAFELLLLYQL